MVRLYLLGFTHDLKGVVFSQRKNGKSAAFWVPVDDAFLDAIDKLEGARSESAQAAKARKAGKAKATRDVPRALRAPTDASARVALPPVGRSQSSSRLPVSEIQQLLREGRSVKTVVDASKAPQAWVERLLEPVLTERAGVVRLTQRALMSRPRLGRSGLPVGDAVLRNLEERRATTDTIEGIDDAWDARATRGGTWKVWVKFGHRGKRRTAEWEFRKSNREVRPRNRLAAQLGWWPPEPPAAPERSELSEDAAGETTKAEEAPPKRRRKPARKRKPTRRPTRKTGPKAKARPKSTRRPVAKGRTRRRRT